MSQLTPNQNAAIRTGRAPVLKQGQHHTHFAVAQPLVSALPSEHVQRRVDWLSDQCVQARLNPKQQAVVVDRIARGHSFGYIRKARALDKGEAEALFREALAFLECQPGFWEQAREFQREIVPCAENRDDHDERPDDMRGVSPDSASKRFQGARLVPRDDLRVRQRAADACRMWALANA